MFSLIRLSFLSIALVLLSACYGSPAPDCPDSGDLSEAVITGFSTDYVWQYIQNADGERHLLNIGLQVDYTRPDSNPVSHVQKKDQGGLEFSLFASARATSCAPPELPEKIVSFAIYSDSDYDADHPAGANLSQRLLNRSIEGEVVTGGLSFLLFGPLPTIDLEHQLTLEIELDSGAVHRVELDPITFPEQLPSQTQYPSEPPPLPSSSAGRLNDTGIDWCLDTDSSEGDCPVSRLPLQDAELGRDALARSGALEKIGTGDAGFDFTKLDANGEALPASASEWHCVRDNYTGLTWEVKADAGLRDGAHSYSWYHPDDSRNGGSPGLPNGGDCRGSDCDTWSYTQSVNSEALCGLTDWRLPSREELLSVVNFAREQPAVDTDFFPETTLDRYWTGDIHADSDEAAWTLNFRSGLAQRAPREADRPVRLVSGDRAEQAVSETAHCTRGNAPATTPVSHFEVLETQQGDEGAVVRHLTTNLEWQRCSLGQTWDGNGCEGPAKVYTWQQALNQVHDHPGWRLPNFKELNSIVELCRSHPAINQQVFPDTPETVNTDLWGNSIPYWTNTPVAERPGSTLGVNFDVGRHGAYETEKSPADLGRVRLVRDSATSQ